MHSQVYITSSNSMLILFKAYSPPTRNKRDSQNKGQLDQTMAKHLFLEGCLSNFDYVDSLFVAAEHVNGMH